MHPWIWLNEPQHSSAVQAVAAVVATCAAFIVAIFAVLAFIWERKQVSEAHAQTEFVKAQAAASAEQTRIAREQADIAQKAFSEEREQRNVEEARRRYARNANLKKEIAGEEAIRPRWGISPTAWQAHSSLPVRLRFRNYGTSAATSVVISGLTPTKFDWKVPMVPAGSDTEIALAIGMAPHFDVMIEFTTVVGSRWKTLHRFDDFKWTEEVTSVYRPYDLEVVEAFGDAECSPESDEP